VEANVEATFTRQIRKFNFSQTTKIRVLSTCQSKELQGAQKLNEYRPKHTSFYQK